MNKLVCFLFAVVAASLSAQQAENGPRVNLANVLKSDKRLADLVSSINDQLKGHFSFENGQLGPDRFDNMSYENFTRGYLDRFSSMKYNLEKDLAQMNRTEIGRTSGIGVPAWRNRMSSELGTVLMELLDEVVPRGEVIPANLIPCGLLTATVFAMFYGWAGPLVMLPYHLIRALILLNAWQEFKAEALFDLLSGLLFLLSVPLVPELTADCATNFSTATTL